MVCSLRGLIVAPAFQSVISTMPRITSQNCLSKCLKIDHYKNYYSVSKSKFNLFINSFIVCVYFIYIIYYLTDNLK